MERGIIFTGKLPEDIRSIILDKQTELKKKCNCIKSQESTVYHIIREWAKQEEKGK